MHESRILTNHSAKRARCDQLQWQTTNRFQNFVVLNRRASCMSIKSTTI